jgi:hypothetical protein
MNGVHWPTREKGAGDMITIHLSLSLWPQWDHTSALQQVE